MGAKILLGYLPIETTVQDDYYTEEYDSRGCEIIETVIYTQLEQIPIYGWDEEAEDTSEF
jgi:hypothetical protein